MTCSQTGVNPEDLQAVRKARKKLKEKANGNHSTPLKICAKVSLCSLPGGLLCICTVSFVDGVNMQHAAVCVSRRGLCKSWKDWKTCFSGWRTRAGSAWTLGRFYGWCFSTSVALKGCDWQDKLSHVYLCVECRLIWVRLSAAGSKNTQKWQHDIPCGLFEFPSWRILLFGWFQYKEQGVTHEVLSHNNVAEEQRNGQLEDRHSESDLEEAVFIEPLCTVHSIILDWTSASFIDSVGAKAIKQVRFLFSSLTWGYFQYLVYYNSKCRC